MLQAYSSLFPDEISSAGISVVEGKEVVKVGVVEGDEGEAVDVMMERREAVDEGATGGRVACALAFLLNTTIKDNNGFKKWSNTFFKRSDVSL